MFVVKRVSERRPPLNLKVLLDTGADRPYVSRTIASRKRRSEIELLLCYTSHVRTGQSREKARVRFSLSTGGCHFVP